MYCEIASGNVSERTSAAILAYLDADGRSLPGGLAAPDEPLFRNCAFRKSAAGGRLSPQGLYNLIAAYGKKAGIARLTPHKIRHSAITIYLDKSDGNIVEAQGLSDHADIRTLGRYDDNRKNRGAKATKTLEALLED